jgi:hypothetical protein
MNIFCRLFSHTWVHRTSTEKISWNTTKGMAELEATTEVEPRFWLECQRCGLKNESPSRDDVKRANN